MIFKIMSANFVKLKRANYLKSILAKKLHIFKKSAQLDEFISAHLCKSTDVKYFVKLIILSACPKNILRVSFLGSCLAAGTFGYGVNEAKTKISLESHLIHHQLVLDRATQKSILKISSLTKLELEKNLINTNDLQLQGVQDEQKLQK